MHNKLENVTMDLYNEIINNYMNSGISVSLCLPQFDLGNLILQTNFEFSRLKATRQNTTRTPWLHPTTVP